MTLDRDRLIRALPSYEIGEEVGRGAWGIVVAAQHRQLGRTVAIKELPVAFASDPGVRRRFNSEARLLASLDHPHIVPIYDYVEDEGLCLLVMEMLSGGTVWSRFTTEGVSAAAACSIVVAACSALDHAHASGVLHRDIKPENMLFSATGTLKVSDFGIAKVVGGAASMGTRTGEVLGTPAYMAPEQALGGELGPATDVYALGTVLYELLSGRLPYADDGNPIGLLYRHVHEDPTPLGELRPDLSPVLVEVTMRALAREPDERFASAEDFGVAITDAAAAGWGSGWVRAGGVHVMATGRIGEQLSNPPAVMGFVAEPPAQRTRSVRAAAATVAGPAVANVDEGSVDLEDASPAELVPLNEIMEAQAGGDAVGAPAPPPAPATVADRPVASGPPPSPVLPPLTAPSGGRSRRMWLFVALGVVVVVGAIVAAVLLVSGGGDSVTATDDSTAATGEATPEVVGSVFVGQGLDHMARGAGGVWVTNLSTRSVGSIDPATETFEVDIRLDAAPHAIVEADGVLWVSTQSSQLLRIDPNIGGGDPEITAINVPGPINELAVGEGAVWGTIGQTGDLIRVSLDQARVVATIDVGPSPDAVAVGAGSVWVVNRPQGANGTVTKVDPSSNRVNGTVDVGIEPDSVTFGAGSVWVANPGSGDVSRIDPSTDTVVATIPMGGVPNWVTADGSSIWVSDGNAGTVSRVDAETNTVTATVRVGATPESSVVLGDSLWVANLGDGTVSRIALRG